MGGGRGWDKQERGGDGKKKKMSCNFVFAGPKTFLQDEKRYYFLDKLLKCGWLGKRSLKKEKIGEKRGYDS